MRHPSATVRHPYHSLGWTVALAILLGVPGSARAQEQAHDSVQMLQPIVVEAKAAGYSASVISSATKTPRCATCRRRSPSSAGADRRPGDAEHGGRGALRPRASRWGRARETGTSPRSAATAPPRDFFVDGVRDDAQYLRDLYNVERVEALKGANAMIFGRGAGGGVINRVTKEAGGRRRAR